MKKKCGGMLLLVLSFIISSGFTLAAHAGEQANAQTDTAQTQAASSGTIKQVLGNGTLAAGQTAMKARKVSGRWRTLNGRRYYLSRSNRLVTGWLKKGSSRYYLDPADGGAAMTGFGQIGNKAYCFSPKGRMRTGGLIRTADGSNYFASKYGPLLSGFRKYARGKYFFSRQTYKMTYGFVTSGSYTYYMKTAGRQKGQMLTGWLQKRGLRYYFNAKGRLQKGWLNAGGRKYYMNPETGEALTGTQVIDGKTYSFNSDGALALTEKEKAQQTAAAATGPWLIKVNQSTCTITIYRGKTPVKAFACSVGLNGATPDGTFSIMDHLRWHELDGPSWGQWCSHITWNILFHSIPYQRFQDKYSLPASAYNKLGQAASHGCIRLACKDCKYIFDNCPIGTKVIIFHGSRSNDPLGKPMPPYVGSWSKNYDPTDPTV